jgi:acetyltransferase
VEIEAAVDRGHFQGMAGQPKLRLDGDEPTVGSADLHFGSVPLFGAGAQLVEVSRDRARDPSSLTTTAARRTMERTRILTVPRCVRGRAAVDLGRPGDQH